MSKINFRLVLLGVIVLLLGSNAQLFAQSVILQDTEIQEDNNSVKLLFSTNRSIPIECYDLSMPPQIVIDFMGEIYTNKPEIMMVNKDIVKQLRIIRGTRQSQDLDNSYYSVDFIIVDLKEPTRYDFDQGLTSAVLLVAKPGKAMTAKASAEVPKASMPAPAPVMQEKKAEPAAAAPKMEKKMPLSPVSMEEKEYEKPAVTAKPAAPQTTKFKRRRKIVQETPSAPAVSKRKAMPAKKPTTVSKMKRGIKNIFSFGKKPKKKEKLAQPTVKESTSRERIAKSTSTQSKLPPRRRRRRPTSNEEPPTRKAAPQKIKSGDEAVYLNKIEQAKELVKAKQHEVNQANDKLVLAEVDLIQAKNYRENIDQRIKDYDKKLDSLKQEFNNRMEVANYIKNETNGVWIDYSAAKTQLSNLLSRKASEAQIKAAQEKYDDKKAELADAIKNAKEAKQESDAILNNYNDLVEKYNALLSEAEQPQDDIEKAQKNYDGLKQVVEGKKEELAAAQGKLDTAEKEYQQYKIQKADEEYRRSLLDIDSSILSSMKQEEMRKQKMKAVSAQDQKAHQEETRRRIDEAKAKEKAQMEAMKKLEDKSTTRTHRRKDNVTARRRKSIPLAEKAPEEVMQSREDVLKSAIELRNAGLEMQRKGDLDSAIKYYQQALLSDPKFATVHNDLGILYEQKGLDEKAKMEYLAALKIDPQYIKAHSNLALLYEKSGDNDKAYYHWKQRAQLGNPDDPWTQKAKQRMELLEQRK